MATRAIELVGESPGINRTWAWRNVMLVIWIDKPSPEVVDKLGPIAEEIQSRTRAQKLSHIHIAESSLSMPDAETREAFLNLAHKYASNTACVAAIVEGSGFWASAIRGFITGILVLAPRELNIRMHKQANELLAWFPEAHARLTGTPIDGQDLLQQINHARHYEPSY